MRRTLLSLTFLLVGLYTVKAQQYKPLDDKSEVKFVIKNFSFNTPGSLKGLKGSINFNPSDLVASSFNVSVDVSTISTGVDARDSHIKKEEYFNAEKFPLISFSSTKITKDKNGYTVTGNLTIKGVTRAISFPFIVQNMDNGLIFSGSFTINRKDFGVGGSSAVLSNSVEVSLKVFSVKG